MCGGIFDANSQSRLFPADFITNPPMLFSAETTIALEVLRITSVTAVFYGTAVVRWSLSVPVLVTIGMWQRNQRERHFIKETRLASSVKLKSLFQGTSFQSIQPYTCSLLAFVTMAMPSSSTVPDNRPDTSEIRKIENEENNADDDLPPDETP